MRMTTPAARRGMAALLVPFAVHLAPAADPPARALEVGPTETTELPGGKEADGIQGDFVLKNGFIEAVVAGNLPGRRANMTTNGDAETPGCLYDLCVAGSRNDQLTCLYPGGLKGLVSRVSVAAGGDSGGAAEVVVERTAARGRGRAELHRYVLEPGARRLLVISTYSNHGADEWKVTPAPVLKGLRDVRQVARGIWTGDAMNPADRQAYAWAPASAGMAAREPADPGWAETALRSGETRTFAAAVAPGRSPAEALGFLLAERKAPHGTVKARLREGKAGTATATLTVWLDGATPIPAYPDAKGEIEVLAPAGSHRYAVTDLGRPAVEGSLEVVEGSITVLDIELRPASRLRFEITDASMPGKKCPCKVQLIGIGATPNPDLGVDIQAHGCRNQYHSETGWFEMQAPPGRYRVVVTRGIEYSHLDTEVEVVPGKGARVAGSLRRLVDTRGWVSTDFHSHSTPSGDNYCGTDDRLISFAAEHVEFAPTTEHNRFYDWEPHLKRLGLDDEIRTVVGIELTGPGAHFNSFPFRVVPWAQDGGAPTWNRDPRISAMTLRDYQESGPDRWVQINHPDVGSFFRDRDADGVADGGYPGLEHLIDAAETWSEQILNPRPWLIYTDRTTGKETYYPNRTFAWLQLLNQGRTMRCVAVSDAHAVFGNGVGGWRTYVPSSTDEPAKIDHREVVRNARAGRMVITNGPYLEVRAADGTLPGGSTVAAGGIDLEIRVQSTSWIDIDRVQVLVNGRMPPSLNFTRARDSEKFAAGTAKFQARVQVPLTEDAHLIVAAVGETFTLRTGFGESWQATMHPCAFSNPIFVDIDGRGFQPNGDTLGEGLPVGKKRE